MLIKDYCGSLYGNYRQKTFGDVYPEVQEFLTDYQSSGIPTTITEDSQTTLFYLLYARYGNSTIASSDIHRFKYQLFSIIFQYGATWEKRLDIQDKLRHLSDDELMTGSMQIYNRAENPGTQPSTDADDLLQYINNQNVAKNKKGKLEAYGLLEGLLVADVTGDFLKKFQKLFLTVVQREQPLYYVTEDQQDE